MTTVWLRGKVYQGELLYLYNYPRAISDEHGRVTSIVQHPQRVGLKIGNEIWHFTVPEKVEHG